MALCGRGCIGLLLSASSLSLGGCFGDIVLQLDETKYQMLMPVEPDDELADLAWLAGLWATEGGVTQEFWTGPAGGVMLGVNRSLGHGSTFYEYLRIEATPDGVVYHASPMGRTPPTPFRLVETVAYRAPMAADEPAREFRAVFENQQHDFPRRIEYRLDGEGELKVRVEGEENGREKSLEWSMRRAYPLPFLFSAFAVPAEPRQDQPADPDGSLHSPPDRPHP